MRNLIVVTHGYTDGTSVSVCGEHEGRVPNFSTGGASYSGVSHGAHEGTCELHLAHLDACTEAECTDGCPVQAERDAEYAAGHEWHADEAQS